MQNVTAYFSNGTRIWSYYYSSMYPREVQTADLDNDSYFDEVIIIDAFLNMNLTILNRSGDVLSMIDVNITLPAATII